MQHSKSTLRGGRFAHLKNVVIVLASPNREFLPVIHVDLAFGIVKWIANRLCHHSLTRGLSTPSYPWGCFTRLIRPRSTNSCFGTLLDYCHSLTTLMKR